MSISPAYLPGPREAPSPSDKKVGRILRALLQLSVRIILTADGPSEGELVSRLEAPCQVLALLRRLRENEPRLQQAKVRGFLLAP